MSSLCASAPRRPTMPGWKRRCAMTCGRNLTGARVPRSKASSRRVMALYEITAYNRITDGMGGLWAASPSATSMIR
jgi:hypothetical protein